MTEPIIVGVDGSAPSLQAAGWAGREAAVRGAPLRIVHAALRWEYDVPLIPQPPHWGAEAAAAARELLEQAAIHARAGRPRLEVTTEVVDGGAPEALVAAAEDAQLLVVGSRGRGGFAEVLLGSVSRYAATHAPCPTAVIRRTHADNLGEIVVGVSGRPDQQAVLDFAFREAALRRVALRIVHAWRYPTARAPGDMQPLVYDTQEVEQEAACMLAQVIAGWRADFPDVTLTEQAVHEHPAKALIEASARADLVVIGARTRARSLLGLGGTAHAVLHHAHASAVVVHH